jgi:hypothetical protein
LYDFTVPERNFSFMSNADERRCQRCGKRKKFDCFEENAWDPINKANKEMRVCLDCKELRKHLTLPVPIDLGALERKGKEIERLYGITLKDYEHLYILQNGVCAICRKPEGRKGKVFLVVDHDHETGKVRGLLCSNCNSGLGFFKDSLESLSSARQYLKSSSGSSPI